MRVVRVAEFRVERVEEHVWPTDEVKPIPEHEKRKRLQRKHVCWPCYRRLDNAFGLAEVPPGSCTIWYLAGESRGGKARTCDEREFRIYQRSRAALARRANGEAVQASRPHVRLRALAAAHPRRRG